MDKSINLYEVSSPSGRKLHIYSATGEQAKRVFCREYGLKANDEWCGLRSLSARKMKPQEVDEWEKQADAERGTLLFIKGMLDICAKAHAEASMRKEVI